MNLAQRLRRAGLRNDGTRLAPVHVATQPEALSSPVPTAPGPDATRARGGDGGEGPTLCTEEGCSNEGGCVWECDGELRSLCTSCCPYCRAVEPVAVVS